MESILNPKRILRVCRRLGLDGLAKAIIHRYAGKAIGRIYARPITSKVAELAACTARPPIIIYSTLDWHFPFEQRLHHIARALSESGWPVVFVSPSQGYDTFWVNRVINPKLILVKNLMAAVSAVENPIVYVVSADGRDLSTILSHVAKSGGRIIYDYLDAIDDRVSNVPYTSDRLDQHDALIADEINCSVICTADAIYNDVAQKRSRKYALVTNGVNCRHFTRRPRERLNLEKSFQDIIDLGKPVIGYYGALAEWVDYSLILHLAASLDDVNIVLIGPDYDGSKHTISEKPKNIFFVDPVPYEILPSYAAWFDVSIVPFKVNDVTIATSPLKLFEYMASGLPIVSTAIPEARKYHGVFVAENRQEFVAIVKQLISAPISEHSRQVLIEQALKNDWIEKAAEIAALIESGE